MKIVKSNLIAFFLFANFILCAQSNILDGYISQAIDYQHSIKQQQHLIEKANLAVKEAKAMHLPNINFNTTYSTAAGGRTIAFIYLHFHDKDDLLFAVHEVAFNQFFEKMAPAVLVADPRQRLLRLGELYIEFAFENPELYGLMFMDKAPMNKLHSTDECWICGERAHCLLKDTVALCYREKGISEAELEILSMSIWSYIHGLTALTIRDRFTVLKEKKVDIHQMVHQSLNYMLDRFII